MNSQNSQNAEAPKQPPAFRPYKVRVARTERLSSSFQRIVFQGDDLQYIGTDGYDQRIKILLPLPGGKWSDPQLFDEESLAKGLWWEQWRALAVQDRNPIRTYTIRQADPVQRRLSIDFVLHDNSGPAGLFAQQAVVGDEVVIVGPDRRSDNSAIGIDFHPGRASTLLLVGDETAVPAIGGILEGLANSGWSGSGLALLEVPEQDDINIPLVKPQGFAIDWVSRSSPESGSPIVHGDSLIRRVEDYAAAHSTMFSNEGENNLALNTHAFTDINVDKELLWEVPEQPQHDGFYAWMAGEAATMRTLRKILVRDYGVNRKRVAFMGYWRAGKAEM